MQFYGAHRPPSKPHASVWDLGFDEHRTELRHAKGTLVDLSQAHPPSQWLEETMARPKAAKQLGTLGGGNHFLEVRPGAGIGPGLKQTAAIYF